HDAFAVPRKQRCLGPHPKILVGVADRFAAATEGVQELEELVGGHALAVVGDRQAIHALSFDGPPLWAEFNSRRTSLERLLQQLADVLQLGTLSVRALDEVLHASNAHRRDQDVLGTGHCPSPANRAWRS